MSEEIAGQDEKRDRHDLEAFQAGEQLERNRFRTHVSQREQERQYGEPERDRDRHAGQHQREQQHKHDDHAQALRQHDETCCMRDADRHDQERRQYQDHAERSNAARLYARRADASRMERVRSGHECVVVDALDMRHVAVRELSGPIEPPRHLQEAEAHQPRAERQSQIDDPHRRFEIVRLLAGFEHLVHEQAAEHRDHAGEQRAAKQREDDHLLAGRWRQQVDQHVDADMDAGAHAIGGAEFGHPDEHVDAEFLRPGQIARHEPRIDRAQDIRNHRHAVRSSPFGEINRNAGAVAVQHRDENQRGCGRDERSDEPFLKMIERSQKHLIPLSREIGREVSHSRPFSFWHSNPTVSSF